MAKFEYMERAFSSELRPRARLVLQVLVLHCNKEGECFPSIKTIPASGEEAEKTENVHSSAPDSTPGEQSALFLFPAYSFANGFKERPDGKNAARMLHGLGGSPFLYPLEPYR